MVFSIVRKTLGWHCKHRAKISIACLPTSALRSGGDKHKCWPFTLVFRSTLLEFRTRSGWTQHAEAPQQCDASTGDCVRSRLS
jgi:hypothetical protein